jgi:methionyl-tRNA formyltransferase
VASPDDDSGFSRAIRLRVLFAGTGDIGIPVLRFLADRHFLAGVLTQPDKPAGRRRELKPPAIKEELIRSFPEVPLLQPTSPRDQGVLEWILGLRPDVMVTMAYGRILPPAILAAAPLACINVHASLLPLHRGASPIQAAIAAGDRETGVTIMHMAEGLDTGDMILRKAVTIRRRETSGSLSERLAGISPGALSEALALLGTGKAPRIPQDHAFASHSGKIVRADTFLDWTLPSRVLERRIRSLQPRPGAVAILPLAGGGFTEIKVHSAIVVSGRSGPPGSVLPDRRKGILVACGEGSLLLGSIQPEGGAIMHSSAFLRGKRLAVAGA